MQRFFNIPQTFAAAGAFAKTLHCGKQKGCLR